MTRPIWSTEYKPRTTGSKVPHPLRSSPFPAKPPAHARTSTPARASWMVVVLVLARFMEIVQKEERGIRRTGPPACCQVPHQALDLVWRPAAAGTRSQPHACPKQGPGCEKSAQQPMVENPVVRGSGDWLGRACQVPNGIPYSPAHSVDWACGWSPELLDLRDSEAPVVCCGYNHYVVIAVRRKTLEPDLVGEPFGSGRCNGWANAQQGSQGLAPFTDQPSLTSGGAIRPPGNQRRLGARVDSQGVNDGRRLGSERNLVCRCMRPSLRGEITIENQVFGGGRWLDTHVGQNVVGDLLDAKIRFDDRQAPRPLDSSRCEDHRPAGRGVASCV